MKGKNILIVGGGTGGHISPGIAIYEEFVKRGVHAFVLVGRRDARFSSLADVKDTDLLLYGAPSLTKNPFTLPVVALKFLHAYFWAKRFIARSQIAAVIGMGGYVSGPALLAAARMGVPVYLCEQNSVPGKVTRYFAKRAAAIFTTFAASDEYLKNGVKIVQAGNPIRQRVFAPISREDARRAFNLGHCKRVILLIGGSQGALRLNELMLGLKTKFSGEFADTGVIWSTGDLSYNEYREKSGRALEKGSVYMSPFIENVGAAYRASDIAISRAGSGVMMEIAAMGLPSVMIPYPFAAANHQDKNADEFVEAGAAVKIANDDATPEIAGPIILDLLGNPMRLAKMAEKALKVARPDAAKTIVDEIITALR
ncbi:MAG TPA: undecaprenyldiphospho-muramoylpentapeptide beta-N-acetylglucosaminyltransferase [Spirochaetota bacterium]|nr:undecaprenyldiphospho-muramoylpentapeptide beta-N-acetylglucosaminyltransferase [Spirochaetota bacterium]HNT12085.1 undecaprenyldiphospho-muramoylpentapeptide beta-N-acetylglucosaminyltransferase [Spirochaetota bacterium]HOS41861.1 undecaprenyldiphospho-muramoylpentapeptide beta-N-acetylglucosaminyltransferase [Spirochaetota bacterium]